MDTTPMKSIGGNRQGVVLVYVVMVIVVMFGFLGLAVDGSHLLLVRGELQNAADASALAGAGALYKDPLIPDAPPLLDWNRARTTAAQFIRNSKSDGVSLMDGQIATGCWDPALNTFTAQLTGNECDAPTGIPAVSATISRSAGNNGGPVRTFFARMAQENGSLDTVRVSSKAAVAVSGFPRSAPRGTVFPFVVTKCVLDDYLSTNPPSNSPLLITDTPTYHSSGGDIPLGRWSSFMVIADSARILEKYINYLTDPSGDNALSPPALQKGDVIYIMPKNSATGYHNTQHVIDAGKGVVILPVVGCDINGNTTMVVEGFVTVRLVSTTINSATAYFEKSDHLFSGSRPGGTRSNVVTAPFMVQ